MQPRARWCRSERHCRLVPNSVLRRAPPSRQIPSPGTVRSAPGNEGARASRTDIDTDADKTGARSRKPRSGNERVQSQMDVRRPCCGACALARTKRSLESAGRAIAGMLSRSLEKKRARACTSIYVSASGDPHPTRRLAPDKPWVGHASRRRRARSGCQWTTAGSQAQGHHEGAPTQLASRDLRSLATPEARDPATQTAADRHRGTCRG